MRILMDISSLPEPVSCSIYTAVSVLEIGFGSPLLRIIILHNISPITTCFIMYSVRVTHIMRLYQFEPQWHQYTTHGDFWDWQVMKNQDNGKHCFLPLTLELGSWLWVKKNPLQLLQFNQLFHPIKPHRVKRVQRRHSTLLDYFIQVLDSDLVVQLSPSEKQKYQRQALKLWFQ